MKKQIIIYGIVIVIFIIIIYTLGRRIGLIRSRPARQAAKEVEQYKAEKKVVKLNLAEMDYFKPGLYKTAPSREFNQLLSHDEVKVYATKLHNALKFVSVTNPLAPIFGGRLGQDEEAIYNVFRNLTDPMQISQIADIYQQAYNSDLLGDLIDKLDKDELQTIYGIIKNI